MASRKVVIHSVLAKRFGARLLAEREKRGLALRPMAKILGVSDPFLSQLETGARSPTLPMVEQIAKKLGKEPSSMLKP